DVEELDVEDEHALRLAGLAFVRELLGDPKASLLGHDHELQALGPSRDHAAERELHRLAARDRRVEHLPVRRPARVVHLHRVTDATPCGGMRGIARSCRARGRACAARGRSMTAQRRRRGAGCAACGYGLAATRGAAPAAATSAWRVGWRPRRTRSAWGTFPSA